MIFQNEIVLGGEVTKIFRRDANKLARIFINVPKGDEDDERDAGKTVNIPVDVVGDQYAQTEMIKEGDFVSCVAQLINQRMQPDGKDKKFTIRWPQALGSCVLTHIPGGGKYAKASFNRVIFQGKCQRIGDLRETGQKKTKMIFVTAAFSPRLDKNATDEEKKNAMVYCDVAFFGGTAEKYIKPYLKEKDIILVTGSLTMYEEDFKFKDKPVMSVRINARDAKFVTPQANDGGSRNNKDKPNYDAYNGGADDDIPF